MTSWRRLLPIAFALCCVATSRTNAQSVSDADDDEDAIDAATVAALAENPDPLEGMTIRSRADRHSDLVVIVSIDGLRADAARQAPTLARLRREGSASDDAWTIERSATLPSHASMLSGVDVPMHGINFNGYRSAFGAIRFPTIFRVARRASLPTVMFVGKNKFRHLEEPTGVERFVLAGRECHNIVARATEDLSSMRQGVMFLHFADPDAAGHRHGWMTPAYRRAVAAADRCVQSVVATLSRRSSQAGRVLLLVTADHGGHGRGHGSPLAVDRHIPWIAWGAGVARDQTMSGRVQTMDTAATALDALGLPLTPGMAGRVVQSIWSSQAPAANRTRTTQRRSRH